MNELLERHIDQKEDLRFFSDTCPGQYFILRTMSILVIICLVLFSLYLIGKGQVFIPVFNFSVCAVFVLNLVYSKRSGKVRNGLYVVTAMLTLHLLVIFTQSMEMGMWSFVFPWALLFLFNTSKSQLISLIFLVAEMIIIGIDLFQGGKTYSIDFALRFPAVYLVMLVFTYFYFKEQKRILQAAHVQNDDLASKKLQFDTLLSFGSTLYIVVDRSGRISFVNSNASGILGESAANLMGKCLFDRINPEDRKQFESAICSSADDKLSIAKDCEFRFLHADKGWIYFQCSVQNLIDNPAIGGILVTAHEITERKNAEQKLKLINERLETMVNQRTEKLRQNERRLKHSEKMEALGQLAGGIAHDFNNQLAGIISCADLMLMTMHEESEAREMIETIISSALQASKLIEQLLAFARKSNSQKNPVDLHDVIDLSVSILQRSIDKKITIEKKLLAERRIILGDYAQLQNVFLNLGLNARDAMKDGGTLVFSTENFEAGQESDDICNDLSDRNDLLLITVSDTGNGMDLETQKHIFEPFYTTKGAGRGTGMGLAAVYGTIESHEGIISVKSSPGQGTAFSIYLPLSDHEVMKKLDEPDDFSVKKDTKHIMIVEDEENVRDSAVKILTRLGYKVTTCTNGREAIDKFREIWNEIDLVILDMIMPEIDGYSTFKELTRIDNELKVLMSSGYILNNEAMSIINSGRHGFIRKPYRVSTLAKEIENLI